MKKRANFIFMVMILFALFTIVPSVCSATLVAGTGDHQWLERRRRIPSILPIKVD